MTTDAPFVRAALIPLLCVSGVGCSPTDIGTTAGHDLRSAIENGVLDTGHPAVGALMPSSGEICTGTLVAPSKVLTAAHCVAESVTGTFVLGDSIWDSLGNQQAHYHTVARHPDYEDGGESDIAVLTLESAIGDVEWMATRSAVLDDTILGPSITLVGFGVTEAGNDSGTKHRVDVVFDQLTDLTLSYSIAGNDGRTAAAGDSGGPALLLDGSDEIIIGVTRGSGWMADSGQYTRVDVFTDWLAANGVPPVACSTPCAADEYCLADVCVSDDVEPCNLWRSGCADGEQCVLLLGADGDTGVGCAATIVSWGACDAAAGCTNYTACVPDAPGASIGTCQVSCDRANDSACSSFGDFCAPLPGVAALGYCAQASAASCAGDGECDAPTPVCNQTGVGCVQCNQAADCADGYLCNTGRCYLPANTLCSRHDECHRHCDRASGACIECQQAGDCPYNHACESNTCIDLTPPFVDCDPVALTGCYLGERCVVADDLQGFWCITETGSGEALDPCTGPAQCADGFACVGDDCRKICGSHDDCGESSCFSIENISPWGICSHCSLDEHCDTSAPRCDPNDWVCRECLTVTDCSGDEQCIDLQCVIVPECTADEDCASGHCDPLTETCVACLEDSHCSTGEECVVQICEEDGSGGSGGDGGEPPGGGCAANGVPGAFGLAWLAVLLLRRRNQL